MKICNTNKSKEDSCGTRSVRCRARIPHRRYPYPLIHGLSSLPSAHSRIVHATTQYPHFSFLDLTDEMPKIINEWKQLKIQFDAIYTGYLGLSPANTNRIPVYWWFPTTWQSGYDRSCFWEITGNYMPTSMNKWLWRCAISSGKPMLSHLIWPNSLSAWQTL